MHEITIERLIWDEWNIAHIARHNVVPEEVEEAIKNRAIFEKGKKGRIRLIAPTQENRMLAIILDSELEEGTYYPVTSRDASRKEKRAYQETIGGEKAA